MIRARLLAALVSLVLMPGLARAAEPIRIGVLTDMNGILANDMGPGSVLAAQMAVEEMGGKVGDRPVEIISGDHQNKPDIGTTIARQWYDQGVTAIVDVPNSAIALGISALAAQKNRVFASTGASTTELTGAHCNANTVHWPTDNYAIGHVAGQAILAKGGKKWFFITADYAFGYDIEAQTSDAVKQGGGSIVGAVRTPIGTTDFSSYLIQARSSGADVLMLAMVGDDTTNALKQAAEFGIGKTMRLAAPTSTQIAVRGLGLQTAQGLLAVGNFEWNFNDRTRAFAARFEKRFPRHWPPTNMQAGTYSAVIHIMRALQAGADPMDGRAVVAKMKALPTDDDAFGPGSVRIDGRKMENVYLMQVKTPAESTSEWDQFKILAKIPAEQAFRPLADGKCNLAQMQ